MPRAHAGPRFALRRATLPACGQSLVEFALLLPILIVMGMAVIEYAFAFNATLGVNRASQNAAHTASLAGNAEGADCLILDSVERDIRAPNHRSAIQRVEIQRTAMAGNVVYAQNTWQRTGSTTCTLHDGATVDVPYTRSQNGYPTGQRCTILIGCPTYTPARSKVDNVGVIIRYRYDWITPLGTLLPLIGGDANSSPGWTFQKRNIFRMEPNL